MSSGYQDGTRLVLTVMAVRRVVAVDKGFLNRYWDDSKLPRQESHAEDLEIVADSDREPAHVFRDIRAACESGWDFSSRWLKDERSMASIQTTRILPVDLNSALHKLESVLARGFTLAGKRSRARHYQDLAERRKSLVQSLFFSERHHFFVDLLLPDLDQCNALTLAAVSPLFFNLATPEQAKQVAEKIQAQFLKPGGWVTTLINSGHQWDAPNGWPPLQWIVYAGLRNYGYMAEAEEGARRWVENSLDAFRNSGRLFEKYNVENTGLSAVGGEYEVQHGFGWTNGVLLRLMDELNIETSS